MNIRIFAKTVLAALFCTSTFAAVDHDRSWQNEHRMAISMDPLSWVNGNFRAQFEASINDRLAINIPILVGVEKVIFDNAASPKTTTFHPRFGVKYYVTGKATHQGFYINPLVGFFISKVNDVGSTKYDVGSGLSYGFRTGYAWNIWKGFWLDSYLGYENAAVSFNSDGNKSPGGGYRAEGTGFGNAGSGFTTAVMIGYTW